MNRSKYYRPAKLSIYTYILTGFAALVVFSSVLYLNLFHEPNKRLLSANRFPADYPPIAPVSFVDSDGQGHFIADGICGSALIALLPAPCPQIRQEHHRAYAELRDYLHGHHLVAPPLYLVEPKPEDLGEDHRLGDEDSSRCLDCRTHSCWLEVRSSWQSGARLYQHFNQTYDISTDDEHVCQSRDASNWILLDGNGRPLLYFHKLGPAPELARDYLTILTESARELSRP